MKLIRKLKINKLFPVSFSDKEIKLINYINDWTSDLTKFIENNKPNCINYMKGDLFVLQQNNQYGIIYLRYSGLWSYINYEFNTVFNTGNNEALEEAICYLIQKNIKDTISKKIVIREYIERHVEETFKEYKNK